MSSAPPLTALAKLERIELGQLRGLHDTSSFVAAPGLRELLLLKRVNVSSSDVAAIKGHKTLERLDWFGEDIPVSMWEPIVQAVNLPRSEPLHPEGWFARRGRTL